MEKYPVKTDGIVYRNPDSFFGYSGWPSVCYDDEGTLYTVYSGFRGSHVDVFGKTCMCKSYDNGKTWSVPMIINDTWMDDRDAGIICLGGKKLLVSWFTNPADFYTGELREYIWEPSLELMDRLYADVSPEYAGGGSYIRISEDGGLSWGETIKLPISAPHGPILRRDGSILYLGKELWNHGPEIPHVILAMESRDEGKTWQELGRVPLPEVEGIGWGHLVEPHVLELEDGSLIGVIRGHRPGFTVYITRSYDGGKTWSVPTQLDVNGSPPHIMQHSSGAIIITFGRRGSPFGERAIVSWDGGETWQDEYVLRDDGLNVDLGYPATVELPDKKLLTVYYQAIPGDKQNCIQSTIWEL